MRWPILRSAFLVLALLAGISFAARKNKDEPESPPAAAEVEVAPAVEVAPPAPPLFTGSLPVAVQELPDGLANLSAQGCNACHFQVHDDWQHTAHAAARRSPAFQLAVERAGGSTACRACHLPLANQHPRLAAGYLDGDLSRPDLRENPLWDPTLMSEGVTCAACHVRDGMVVGTRATTGAPHPVAVSTELSEPRFCATCHQLTWPDADRPFYDTYGEWERSPYAAAGVRCQDCHMPPVAGLATATRFAATASHAFPADPARGLSVLVSLARPELQRGEPFDVSLRLQNTGAGHHIPTGSPFQRTELRVELLDVDDKPLATPYTVTLARVVEEVPPYNTLSDNRLGAGEERTLAHQFTVDQRKKSGLATLRVSLWRSGDGEDARVLQEIPIPVY